MKCLLTSDIQAVRMSDLSINGVARLPESLPSGYINVDISLVSIMRDAHISPSPYTRHIS